MALPTHNTSNVRLIDFTTLNLEELKMILEWRNHPTIRKWMITQKPITWDQHLNFIQTLKSDKTKKYFLVKKQHQSLGVISFHHLNTDRVSFGIYKNPSLQQKGIGQLLQKTLIDYAFQNTHCSFLVLEVFKNNLVARRLYEKFGFQPLTHSTDNNSPLITLQLSRKRYQSQYY